ncbi:MULTISPECIES: Fe2+-dependent dioxygenase [unclassified Methylophilus]|uniref:Fe2+-dependent dioxygenase n=1 Tax=unclassified Methylophilus TaxID=2630143 RepID=UPI00036545BB|nr:MULTISPECIES: Fe2+-dependent dioxygenase [unclassified Methylophilus]
MLLTLPDVLLEDELTTIRGLLKQAQWIDGRNTAGAQAAQVKNNQQLAEQDPLLANIRGIVLQALHRDPLFFSAALPDKILPPFVNRYAGQNNHYGFHVDSAMRSMPDGSARVRADVSATLFFNDPDEYDGGELVVQDVFGDQRIKLKAGSIVIYPSSSVHAVTPVTRGERLASFMFIQSMVRDAAHRRMLFDMDMALVRLRQQHGETAEVVQLTGIYHNLLRQWAL